MQTSAHNTARITDIIYFHGTNLHVITFEGAKYLPAKPLIESLGIDWRSAKRTIIEEENAILYGTTTLNLPNIALQSVTADTQIQPVLCFKLELARWYLARVNTRIMKARGNVEAANALLKLQLEWAKAIHDYETQGIATKDKNKTDIAELMNLMKLRQMAHSTEKLAFTHLLHQKMLELGLPVSKQQLDLLD